MVKESYWALHEITKWQVGHNHHSTTTDQKKKKEEEKTLMNDRSLKVDQFDQKCAISKLPVLKTNHEDLRMSKS